MGIKTSTKLTPNETYSRERLRDLFGIKDATLNNGIFQPEGHNSVWLFITDSKGSDRTQYEDRLEGNDLYFEGQTMGRTDLLIKEHKQRGLELLLFYRARKDERPDYSFKFEGRFEYLEAQAGPPTKFHLRRVEHGATEPVELQAVDLPLQLRENVRRFMRDAPGAPDRALSLIRQTAYWVFDAEDGTFGPAKFVGFQRMTFARYEEAIRGRGNGDPFDGHFTRNAIEKILGAFEPSMLLAGLLSKQVASLVGQEGLRGVDQTKWAFAVIPSTRSFWALLCNPEKFDALGATQALEEIAWTVHRGEFREGDRAVVWQSRGSGSERGIIAVGEVSRGVLVEACPANELAFWRVPEPGEQNRIRIRVAHGGNLPLWESSALPWLSDLAVARARGGTVFTLKPEEWYAISEAANLDAVQAPASRGDRKAARQGFGLTPVERRAVERHAQQLAEEHFISLGFEVEDVSARRCYDLCCTNGHDEVRVEVKGTTGGGDIVLLTRNEVTHAREQRPLMALVVVSDIRIQRRENSVFATGGNLRIIRPWAIDEGQLVATKFEYRPKA